MKSVIIIPARLESTRFPRKILQNINGRSLIERCYENFLSFEPYVATPDKEIADVINARFPMKAIMTSLDCKNGTERVAEAADILELDDNDIVIDVQGDQFGFADTFFIEDIIQMIEYGAQLMTVVCPLRNKKALIDRNVVKAFVKIRSNQVDVIDWFARKIPSSFLESENIFQHVGIYAARKKMFDWYKNMIPFPEEETLKMEQLRWKESFVSYYLPFVPVVIDTPEDVQRLDYV